MSGWKSILAMFAAALILVSGGKAFSREMRVIDYNQRFVRQAGFQNGVYGNCLIVFSLFLTNPLHELKPISVFSLDSTSCHSADTALSSVLWESPGFQRYRIETNGYSPITIDSVRSVPDSVLFVRIEIHDEKCDSCESSIQSIAVSQRTRPLFEPVPDRRISGVVTDCSLGKPIPGARVHFEETDTTLVTDSAGRFFISPGTLTRATLDVWHPLYDSIRFTARFTEREDTKELQVCFESQRRSQNGKLLSNKLDSAVYMLVYRKMQGLPRNESIVVNTYAVYPGSLFGRLCSEKVRCAPFRFLGLLPDGSAWLKFSEWYFGSADDSFKGANFVLIGDHPSTLRCALVVSAKTRGVVESAKTWEVEVIQKYEPKSGFSERRFFRGGVR